MRDFIAQHQGSERFTDQYFLKMALWPTVRESILTHDDIFLFHSSRTAMASASANSLANGAFPRWQQRRFCQHARQ